MLKQNLSVFAQSIAEPLLIPRVNLQDKAFISFPMDSIANEFRP